MNTKLVFTVTYILALVFGIGFVVLPAFILSLMGLQSSGQAPLLARGWGAFILGVSALAFFSRNASRSDGRRAVLLALFALYILLDLYTLSLNLFSGVPVNWMLALLYLVHTCLAVAYAYLLFGPPREIDA
jgi:hypothetical protein